MKATIEINEDGDIVLVGNNSECIISQAAAGNWCCYIVPYDGEPENFVCFNSEAEAIQFYLNYEKDIN